MFIESITVVITDNTFYKVRVAMVHTYTLCRCVVTKPTLHAAVPRV